MSPLGAFMAVDQPVTQEASRGPKSRAGLIAYPDVAPRLMPIATTRRPMMKGARLAAGAVEVLPGVDLVEPLVKVPPQQQGGHERTQARGHDVGAALAQGDPPPQ